MKSIIKQTMLGLMVLSLAACSELDVVARDAQKSFQILTATLKPTDGEDAFQVTAPDGAAIFFSKSWVRGELDIGFLLDPKPFRNAGVDVSRLPDQFPLVNGGQYLLARFELGTSDPVVQPSSLQALFTGLVANYRDRIGYHEQFDHYGLALGDGHMLEWAKDPAKNDKDLVLVLDPQPFLKAGLKPAALTGGWLLGQVTVKDKDGAPAAVDKLLKPYNLQ